MAFAFSAPRFYQVGNDSNPRRQRPAIISGIAQPAWVHEHGVHARQKVMPGFGRILRRGLRQRLSFEAFDATTKAGATISRILIRRHRYKVRARALVGGRSRVSGRYGAPSWNGGIWLR